ncbi:unnamed protein product [Periconia digitata]|uniref:Uncharacterized protein n=1 Tax=Periconia digitata TaxID=1303443 RepID=A0A9W4XTP3_9PLEO|nr:unnamed protein product [Periconia digitata]
MIPHYYTYCSPLQHPIPSKTLPLLYIYRPPLSQTNRTYFPSHLLFLSCPNVTPFHLLPAPTKSFPFIHVYPCLSISKHPKTCFTSPPLPLIVLSVHQSCHTI